MDIPLTQYVVNDAGQKTAVLMPIETFEQLIEDLHDLAVIAQRRNEEVVDLDRMLKRLGIEDELRDSV